MLKPIFSHAPAQVRIDEQLKYTVRRALRRMNQIARDPIDDLDLDAAYGGPDDRFFLPRSFTYREAKAFLNRFLQYNGGSSNESVDFDVTERRQKQDVNVGIRPCRFANLLEH